MCSVSDDCDGGWDRTFLDISSRMAEPFCGLWHLVCFRLAAPLDPQKFENCDTKTKEIAVRILIGSGTIVGAFLTCAFPAPIIFSAVALGTGSKVCRAIGFALQKNGYTHVRGRAPEKVLEPADPQVKVMTLNVCGVGGGMSLDHGGVVHWRDRLDGIVEKIKNEDPDVLVLQEVYDTALSEALIERFQFQYAHFFTHLGANVMGSVGGCMVIAKCAVHQFSHTSFNNNHWTLNRGFASLELKASPKDAWPCIRVIGTHLIHGDQEEDRTKRLAQVAQLVDHVARQTLAVSTILTGDLNIDRDRPEGTILHRFNHGYQGAEPTCTNRLTAQWDLKARSVWGETIDYISLFRRNGDPARIEDCHLIKTNDASNTKTALSDHHGLAAAIRGLTVAQRA